MKAKQDSTVDVEELPEVVVNRCATRLAEERLIPVKAARDISDANDGPSTLHLDSIASGQRTLRGKFMVFIHARQRALTVFSVGLTLELSGRRPRTA